MSPLPPIRDVLHILGKRREEVGKPKDPAGLVLEAWAEGFMVGSLIIMSCITLANMRRGVLLHKLILLEVGLHGNLSLYVSVTYTYLCTSLIARPRLLARLLHPLQSARICVVVICGRDISERLVVPAQRHCVDEAPTIFKQDR
jgi:hypothetical protein